MKIMFPNYFKAFNANFLFNKSMKSFSEEIINKANNSSNKTKLFFSYGVTSLPHIDKRQKGGEDAHCENDRLLAVADGVGGWNDVGVDPSLYSKDLCSNIMKQHESDPSKDLLQVFITACKNTKYRGSSTCTICKINSPDKLEALNLGDSGYLILRPNYNVDQNNYNFEIIFKSEEQTHGFNFPYQVGEGGDNPAKAEVKFHSVKPYDLLILATDGLWDNISNENIIKVIKKFLEKKEIDQKAVDKAKLNTEGLSLNTRPLMIDNLNALSDYITKTTETLSLDKSYKSPFSVRSKGLFIGGKHDDITVIVAQILDKTTKF